MALLLTILSAIAAWAFVTVLALGLLLVLKPLQSIRGYLEKIAAGVRAIEQQTGPLAERADTLAAGLAEVGGRRVRGAADRLADTDDALAAAGPALRRL